MVRADEIRKGNGQIEFSLTVLGTPEFQPKLKVGNAKIGSAAVATTLPRNGLNLSGSQVFIGLGSALCMIGVMLWVVIQLWLFE